MENPLRILRSRQGVALLITLSVTTLLVTMALEYNRRARFNLIAAAAARDSVTLTQMASAGVQVAMVILAKDKVQNTTDTLLDDWANPLKIEEVLQDFPFDDGKVSIVITDEMGKIQVNALVNFPDSRQFNDVQRALWERFLQFFADRKDHRLELKGDSEPQAIINSLKDWLDSGDDDAISGLTGAESSYYMSRQPPYPSRNGPVADLNELLLVKGITPEIFYGTPELPGIARYLTAFGQAAGAGTTFSFPGRINFATAELPVLSALLPPENQGLAEIIDQLRQDIASGKKEIDFKDPNWFAQVPGLANLKLDPKLVTLTSDLFRVESVASRQEASTQISAVVQRVQGSRSGKWTCRILSWQVN